MRQVHTQVTLRPLLKHLVQIDLQTKPGRGFKGHITMFGVLASVEPMAGVVNAAIEDDQLRGSAVAGLFLYEEVVRILDYGPRTKWNQGRTPCLKK